MATYWPLGDALGLAALESEGEVGGVKEALTKRDCERVTNWLELADVPIERVTDGDDEVVGLTLAEE